jgi:GDP-mannose 6-dehydrogenase
VTVTSNAAEAIEKTNVSFICVGTPSLPNGDQDLTALLRLADQLGSALKSKEGWHTIVVRSTVQPGTVLGEFRKIIEQTSGMKSGSDFSLCFQPEFLREGSSIKDYDNPPMTVVGTVDDKAADELRSIFGQLPCQFIETDITTAEMLKYACNAFHTYKLTFANEIGRICQALGADSRKVMSLLCEDHQLNISKAYLRPGFAFGMSKSRLWPGSYRVTAFISIMPQICCLPKGFTISALSALASRAVRMIFERARSLHWSKNLLAKVCA